MEKKERVKYYPISLKDKKLHNEFMILERTLGFQNVDDTLRSLIEDSKAVRNLTESNNVLRVDLVEALSAIVGLKEKIKELEERVNYYKGDNALLRDEIDHMVDNTDDGE